METPEIWLICGGRDFNDRKLLDAAMDHIINYVGIRPETIVHGGAKGADSMGGEWAKARHITVIECKADWNKHGKAAGPIRNQEMLDIYKPNRVIAFPGGTGTAHMVRISKEANVPVYEVLGKPQ